ncbi:DUF3152 domain-containing protein [Actinomadura roseirufa]|uniref:DUF3152 domain-containing protein n=1 Tax=Actinomadura roseirufa TaxID=2094049 RepID=UPI001A954A60|nr:DUF3152 domain-containing protein [Actinomadura roseirufa]
MPPPSAPGPSRPGGPPPNRQGPPGHGQPNQSTNGQPGYDPAGYDQPGYDQPGYDQPGYDQPGQAGPAYEQPAYDEHPPGGHRPPPATGGRRPGGRGTGRRATGTVEGLSDDLDREFEGARRSRLRGVIMGVTAVVVLVGLGVGGMLVWMFMPPSAPVTSGPRKPSGDRPSDPTAEPKQAPPYVPANGTGKFIRSQSAGRTVGRGKLMRYMVEVEGGLKQSPTAFTRSVDKILADPRGWTAGGRWAFRRVDSGSYDFVVRLASPGTVDKICGRYGMTTEGEVNCSAGKQVVVNLKRWLLLTSYYKGQPDNYHALTINHEVGHRLGFGHMTCPGPGRPAPVMQQQIFGLKGCKINGWPFDSRRRFLSGPAVQ